MVEIKEAPASTNIDLMQDFKDIVSSSNQDLIQENANVDGKSPCGQMNKFASESAKFYAKQNMLRPEARQAMEDNYIHIHDLDYMPTGTATCCQIPLGKLLKKRIQHRAWTYAIPAKHYECDGISGNCFSKQPKSAAWWSEFSSI